MDAKIISKFSSYNEELEVNAVEDTGIYATGENLKKYISTIEEGDLEKFVIIKSKLLYVGTDKKETEIANKLGIGGGEATSDAGATVKEVQAIADGVVEVSEENKENIPVSDTDKTDEEEHFDDSEGLIGTRLFDRSSLNLANGNWNILIEYNNQNKETARYGSGYYWLKKGQKYTIKGEEIEFKNDYVINYKNEEFTVLSGRAVNWNVDATLGVPDKIVDGKHTLALNLDPMSLANGEWRGSDDKDEVNKENFENFIVKNTDNTEVDTGIQKVGDVEYDSKNKALKINEDEKNNPEGLTGYMRYESGDLNLTNGFTFEFYGNFDEIHRKNLNGNGKSFGLFSKTISLVREGYAKSFRCGCSAKGDDMWLAVSDSSREVPETGTFKSSRGFQGRLYSKVEDHGFKENEDVYISYVWQVYNIESSKRYKENNQELYNNKKGNFDEEMDKYYNDENRNLDKILYFVNSELKGYGYMDHEDFINGTKYWGSSDAKFYIGACNFNYDGEVALLKGKCYATRMYTNSLTTNQVKLNYDMTLKYRDSFKNE